MTSQPSTLQSPAIAPFQILTSLYETSPDGRPADPLSYIASRLGYKPDKDAADVDAIIAELDALAAKARALAEENEELRGAV